MQLDDIIIQNENQMVQKLLSEQILLYECFATQDYQLSRNKLTREQMCMVLENEVISTLNNFSWSGMWQLQALCTALEVSILSVYPDANRNIRSLFNRVIHPLLPCENNVPLLSILWCGYMTAANQFQPNHFVPLVDKSQIYDEDSNNLSTNIYLTNSSSPHIDITIPDKLLASSTPFALQEDNSLRKMHTQRQLDTLSIAKHLPTHYCIYSHQLILTASPKQNSNTTGTQQFTCAFCSSH